MAERGAIIADRDFNRGPGQAEFGEDVADPSHGGRSLKPPATMQGCRNGDSVDC
jgi:hypothetical protein